MNRLQLFRVGIRVKETDKRKSATVHRYVVMAYTLDEAKALAVAKWLDPEDYDYKTHTRDRIAEVSGHGMGTLAYNADLYSERDKSEHPESLPSVEAVQVALSVLSSFEAAAAFAEHQAADPHCTCNDCIADHATRTGDVK